uniref:Uncharacterized protein K02A2.6 n=1 Tax=Schistocephalus solidus TaxID=70667 RepID=A0A0V0JA95_SCHSO
MSILQQQQAQFEAAHLKMMESMMQQFSWQFPNRESSGKQNTSADVVAACITEFIYDPDSGVTFNVWLKRWEDIFRIAFAKPMRHGRCAYYYENWAPKNTSGTLTCSCRRTPVI